MPVAQLWIVRRQDERLKTIKQAAHRHLRDFIIDPAIGGIFVLIGRPGDRHPTGNESRPVGRILRRIGVDFSGCQFFA